MNAPERIEHDLLHPHAGLRKAPAIVRPVALLHVLPEGELDEARCAIKVHGLRPKAPPQLEQAALSTDGVSASMELVYVR